MPLELPRETEKALMPSIQQFCRETLEEDVGELKARLFLDFCLKEICPSVYNQAIRDAQSYLHEKVTDLDATCFQPEMTFWKR